MLRGYLSQVLAFFFFVSILRSFLRGIVSDGSKLLKAQLNLAVRQDYENLQVAAHCFDHFVERTYVHILPANDLGDRGLLYAKCFRKMLLG